MTASAKRLLLVHAHPDDETITTGGTIARYASEGVEVTVLTCTLGEEGEVIGDAWAGLVASEADQLGGYRIAELCAALSALGSAAPRFLAGAGRYRDLRNDRHTFGRQSPCFCQCSTRRSSWRGGRRHS